LTSSCIRCNSVFRLSTIFWRLSRSSITLSRCRRKPMFSCSSLLFAKNCNLCLSWLGRHVQWVTALCTYSKQKPVFMCMANKMIHKIYQILIKKSPVRNDMSTAKYTSWSNISNLIKNTGYGRGNLTLQWLLNVPPALTFIIS
jgi:hypothetical protein